ncbi:hypothetical protein Tco_1034443 [Tanacetum coccineum]
MSIISSEQIRNSSSPKRVHFINRITIISKEDELKETRIIVPNATKDNDHDIIVEVEEKVGEEFSGSEIVIEEARSGDVERDNLGDRACKNTKEVEKVREWMKYEEPIDLVDTRYESVYESLIEKMLTNAYIDLDSPTNIMSLACYNAIRNQEYEFRGQNFVEIGRHMHIFVGNMSYVVDFTILKNVEANINPSLSHVVFGWPFVEITKLILDREQGMITFKDGIKEVTFKTSYKDSERGDLTREGHDLLLSRVILSEDDYRRGCERASDLESFIWILRSLVHHIKKKLK